ncbi:hypothetical protein, partial [Achromobacter sp. DMS1]|uniref:hypothetical protein n=1 Tax=Achromobacter sp. DMS1 TaxID=1688405 RepID=UPI001F296051
GWVSFTPTIPTKVGQFSTGVDKQRLAPLHSDTNLFHEASGVGLMFHVKPSKNWRRIANDESLSIRGQSLMQLAASRTRWRGVEGGKAGTDSFTPTIPTKVGQFSTGVDKQRLAPLHSDTNLFHEASGVGLMFHVKPSKNWRRIANDESLSIRGQSLMQLAASRTRWRGVEGGKAGTDTSRSCKLVLPDPNPWIGE